MECLDNGTELKVTMLDALIESQRACSKVTPDTIANCWLHMTFRESSTPTAESSHPDVYDVPEAQRMDPDDFQEYVDADRDVITSEVPTDEDIVAGVRQNTEEKEDGDEEPEETQKPTPTIRDAEAACELLI